MEPYKLLEVKLSEWIGCKSEQIVACSSGTAALHLALESLRIPINKHKIPYNVICPNYTMIACPLAISLSGMVPTFVDPSSDLLMKPSSLENAIDNYTVAIMCVHVYGRLCNMQSIDHIAAKQGIPVIEDMAEAHGCKPHENTEMACWSFYKNKIIHGEEGGCVYFKSEELARYARQLRNVGFTPEHDYTHIPRGHNYRMSNLHAYPILTSLADFSQEYERRRELENTYNDKFCNDIVLTKFTAQYRHSPWVYDIRIPYLTEDKQKQIIEKLQSEYIAARYGFKPMSIQEQFKECKLLGNGNSIKAAEEVILLPLGIDTNNKTIIKTFDILRTFF